MKKRDFGRKKVTRVYELKKIILLFMFLFFSLSALASTCINPALAAYNVGFSAYPTSGNAPLSVQFTDLSQNVTSRSWDFTNDGTPDSTEKNPVYIYNAPGTYIAKLTVDGTPKTTTITVSAKPVLPVAAFSATPVSGNAPITVTFTDTSTGTPTSWLWNFGDGTTYNSQSPPSHTYYRAGTYTVSLTVTNSAGPNTLTRNSLINVSSTTALVTDFSASATSGKAPLTVQFYDLTSGYPTTWAWDFNSDGLIDSNVKNPVYRFNNTGTYTVTLRAGSATASSTNTKSNYITVGNGLQASFIVSPGQGVVPLTVQFSDITAGTPNTWFWDFGDSTSSTLQNPAHTYVQAGNYTVRLTASNGIESNTSERPSAVNVLSAITPVVNTPVVAGFASDLTSGKAPLIVQFTDSSTGNVTSWFWDFGDGNTSTEKNPIHKYYGTGSHSVTLNASNMYEYSILTLPDYITVTDEDGSSSDDVGGSSSGGKSSLTGGGASPEPSSNIDVKVQTQRFITARNLIKFEFTDNATCIGFVEFDAKKTLGKTTTIVEQLMGKSVLSSTKPQGELYKYVNIWVGNKGIVTPDNIENAKIGFRVTKAKAGINETSESTVILQRYNEGKWNPLKTNKTGEDDQYLYYEAETPGFSPFAITSGNISTGENKPQNTVPIIKSNQPPNNKTASRSGLSLGNIEWIKYKGAIRFLVVLMVVLFIGLAVKEKRK